MFTADTVCNCAPIVDNGGAVCQLDIIHGFNINQQYLLLPPDISLRRMDSRKHTG